MLFTEMFLKFVKFCAVGFSGMLVDFGLTFLLKEKLKIHRYVANSLGFCMAASSNYIFNRWWTFKSTNPEILQEFSTFLLIATVGLLINNAVLFMFECKGNFHFYVSKLLAVAVTTVWNFSVNYFYNFQS